MPRDKRSKRGENYLAENHGIAGHGRRAVLLQLVAAGLAADGNGELGLDINTNKQSLDEINTRINAIVKTLRSSGNDFFDLAGKLSDLEDSLGDLRDDLNNSNRDEILDHLQIIDDQLEQINEVLQNIIQTAGGIPAELDEEDLAEQQETLSNLPA